MKKRKCKNQQKYIIRQSPKRKTMGVPSIYHNINICMISNLKVVSITKRRSSHTKHGKLMKLNQPIKAPNQTFQAL